MSNEQALPYTGNEDKFTLKEVEYLAVQSIPIRTCTGCAFINDDECYDTTPSCLSRERSDERDVVFIKVQSNG